MTDEPPPVLVVGGGVAGLVAARELAIGRLRVTVLEASDRFGGQLAPLRLGGVVTDAAAESFATRGGVVAALASELGLGADIVTPLDSPAWLRRADGSSVPLPATSILGIPGVPAAADVIAAIGLRAALRAQLDALIPSPVGARSTSIGELVRRRMGAAVVDGLVAPVVRGVHSTDPDSLPVERAAPGLLQALRREGSLGRAVRGLRERAPAGSQVAGIRGGVHRLADALVDDLRARGVELRTGAAVDAVTPRGVRLASGERLDGEVLLAAPGVAGDERPSRSITLVTLLVEAPELDSAPRGTGVLVAAGSAGVSARALTHATAKWPWLAEAAGGRHVLRLSYDTEPDDAVVTAIRDAEAITGARIRATIASDVSTWSRTLPAEGPVRSHSDSGMEPPEAGEAASRTGLAAVVTSAREAAGRILATPGEAQPSH